MKGIQDDMRQAFVVSKNEFVKYLRGKKIYILGALIFLIWGLITALPYLIGDGIKDASYFTMYIQFMSTTIVIIVTLFAADAISSEFETRTALVVFTRPIKKSSVFIGKLLAAMAFATLAVILYYALSLTVMAATAGIPAFVLESMMYSILYAFVATGVAMLFSSIMKKSGTSAILTFFTLMMFTGIVTMVLIISGKIDVWFMLDNVGMYISGVLEYGTTSFPASETGTLAGMAYQSYDAIRAIGMAIIWGIGLLVTSFLLFVRREL